MCNTPEYASLPPTQIVPTLLDKGVYLGSESSFYRILKQEGQVQHRGRQRGRQKESKPSSYTASGPKQVLTWDITYLPSIVKGKHYCLYLIEDIYSRKIVGHEVYEQESGEQASQLLQRTLMREQCFNQALVLHSDNGSAMKSSTMKAKMEELGVTPSYSRPRVSGVFRVRFFIVFIERFFTGLICLEDLENKLQLFIAETGRRVLIK